MPLHIGDFRLGVPELAIILVIAFFLLSSRSLEAGHDAADSSPSTFGAPFFTTLGILLAVFALIEFLVQRLGN